MPVKIIPAIKRDRMLRRPGGLYAMRSPFCEGPDAGPGFAWGQWGTRDGAVRWAVACVRNLQLYLFSDECSCRLRGEHSLCVVPEFAWTTNEREV